MGILIDDYNRIRENTILVLNEYASTVIEFLAMNKGKVPFNDNLEREAINVLKIKSL